MIPQRLLVTNFMCYRDDVPPLELEDIHVACLCGDNGHGKTALLDAITWALWGEARARTQEELIHQGRQDMAVELDFLARGQRYRVRRRYSMSGRSRQGTTILQLQVSSDNGYREISGNSVRETEVQVRELLHMDYDTFVNTAFLLQGQADKFTRSTPAQRKEALAEVLDLSYYRVLEERAKERSRQAEERIRDVDGGVALRREETAMKSTYQEALSQAEATLAALHPKADAQRTKVDQTRQSVDQLESRRVEMAELTRRLDAAGQESDALEAQVEAAQTRVAGYQKVLEREDEIRVNSRRLEESKSDLETLDRASLEAGALDREIAGLGQAVAVQRERLSGRAEQVRSRISGELEPRVKGIPEVEERLVALAAEESVLGDMRRQMKVEGQEGQGYKASTELLRQSKADLRAEMDDTRRKFDMLDETDATCPLCRQTLGPGGQEHLRLEYEEVGQAAKRRYTEQETQLRDTTARLEQLTARLGVREADFNVRLRKVQAGLASAERELKDARKAKDELGQAMVEMGAIESDLSGQRFALEEQDAMSQLQSRRSLLGYDQEAHRAAQQQVKALEPFAELNRRLREAHERIPGERVALDKARDSLQRRREESQQDQARMAQLREELASLSHLAEELAAAQSLLEDLEGREKAELVQQGVLREQLERCRRLGLEIDRLIESRGRLVEEKAVYDELAVAFGKNGIQALVIETAIPQIQDDANELLGRLTENRMFLKLQLREGRRERRMGLPSEELEIKISDEVGTRSYETFSGGEAFRIDFALRIAMSKLLARRSGAPLPILFVDEGFGSQDSVGQERLKEVIQSIQADFEKIIVITHVDQVKESFPVRIEVTKTGSGSTFVVV